MASAVEGHGVTRCLSYQAAGRARAGDLKIVLAGDGPTPLQVRSIASEGRLASPNVRAIAVPLPRSRFGHLALDKGGRPTPALSVSARVSSG